MSNGFEKKSEEKELNPEGSPHPEIEKEKEMFAANLIEKKPIIEKPVQDTTTPSLRIERWEDGQLRVYKNGNPVVVKPARCLPWTQPSRYISLRDEEDNEVALVTRLDELDKKSREYLEQV